MEEPNCGAIIVAHHPGWELAATAIRRLGAVGEAGDQE